MKYTKITIQELTKAFGAFKPNQSKRRYTAKLLSAIFAGYGVGEPQASILQELKLIDAKRNITKRGRLYLSEYLVSRI